MREYYVNNFSFHDRKSLNYRIKYKILQSCEQGEKDYGANGDYTRNHSITQK
jgi:hypothetical protein